MTKKLLLSGLDCAHCASKIEAKVQELDGVDQAHLNFIEKTLTIQFKDQTLEAHILDSTEKIVKKLEPDVKVKEISKKTEAESTHKSNKKEKSFLMEHIEMIIAVILFAAAFALKGNVSLVVLAVAYALSGREVLVKAVKNIFNGQVFDENFLMAVATIGAIVLGEYKEAVGVMIFYGIGEAFQDYAVGRSRESIKALLDIKADYANVYKKGLVVKVKPETVKVGQIVLVKPGEKIPLDGRVVEGQSFLDTSAITGEPIPRKAIEGEAVYSGYINQSSPIKVEVTKAFEDSTVYKILEMVENASAKKAPTEKFITKFAKYYTPIVVILAAALAILPPLVTGTLDFAPWVNRALIFLVISCPCALVISIPLGFFGGIGASSKNGILIKGGNYLESLASLDKVIFDKTGTLTHGNFKIDQIVPYDCDEESLMERLASAEYYSNHPIAKSIMERHPISESAAIEDYTEIAGKGITAKVKGEQIVAGNLALLASFNMDIPEIKTEAVGTYIHLAADGKYRGYVVIKDQIKKDALDLATNLKAHGVSETIMLTGDRANAAEALAKTLKLDKVYAELLPTEKVSQYESIKAAQTGKGHIAFVGDGINDAPVLALADVGISMGALGSDAAIEAADVVIMNDEPSKIITGIIIAKQTKKIVTQNIVLSLGVKAIVLGLGAAGMASMWAAVFADVGVALLAILNSSRVLAKKY